MPIRNEARYIARALHAVLRQDYPRDKVEILVVDGMSEDGTRDIATAMAVGEPHVQLIDNPERIVPTALNRGVRAAHGEIIIRVDGHAVIAPDYLRRCVETLEVMDADCVGGPIYTVGETPRACGIALAQSSPFGVGNAAFRYATKERYVDTLAFGAYRREVFDRIGLFDPALVRNEDDEFNLRLVRAGGKIWLCPTIQSTYYARSNLRGLWKQYFGYGFWKVCVLQKHGRPASWRHLVPVTFVVALLTTAALSVLRSSYAWSLVVVLLPYSLVLLGASLGLAARHGWRYAPLLPLAFMTLHLGYGLGFLSGLLSAALPRRCARIRAKR
jgi:cellulose synthase/poly-beta-1,6-N-acetylglucosamine synthase-like glycosyltransferase